MSYGREPFYIIGCACGGGDGTGDRHPAEPHVWFVTGGGGAVTWKALQQFVQKLKDRGELEQLLDGTHRWLR